jgi:hypothetical protein
VAISNFPLRFVASDIGGWNSRSRCSPGWRTVCRQTRRSSFRSSSSQAGAYVGHPRRLSRLFSTTEISDASRSHRNQRQTVKICAVAVCGQAHHITFSHQNGLQAEALSLSNRICILKLMDCASWKPLGYILPIRCLLQHIVVRVLNCSEPELLLFGNDAGRRGRRSGGGAPYFHGSRIRCGRTRSCSRIKPELQ